MYKVITQNSFGFFYSQLQVQYIYQNTVPLDI